MSGLCRVFPRLIGDRGFALRPLFAMCGRLRVVKDFELDAALVVAAMCSAFEYGSQGRWP
jgi:hypothetical protein